MNDFGYVELKVTEDASVTLGIQEQLINGGGITPTGVKTIEVDENGTVTEDVTYYASVEVVTDVANTYAAADEGKVVQDGDLEAQTTATFEANDTYDTTTIKQVTVDVPASAVDSGYVYINENGTEDVTGYAQAVVSVPNTYTASDEGKVVDDGELVSQGSATYTSNNTYDTTKIKSVTVNVSGGGSPTLQTKSVSYAPSESQQTAAVTADEGYDALQEVDVTVGAISSTYVGSGIDRNDSTDLTASGAAVTAPAGYYESAATKSVASGSATTPATSITANPSISVNSSTGVITATASATKSVTPTVSAGYVSSGTAGTITVSGSNTSQLPTQAASTITPTTASQLAVPSYHWTTGSVYVAPIPSAYIVPTGTSNITANAAGIDIASYASVDVNVPNSYSAGDVGKVVSGTSLVAQTTSTYTANGSYNTTTVSGITISINTAPTLQSKSVSFTPASAVQTSSVTPSMGFDGLSQVDITVDAIPSAYIIPSGTSAITANGTGIDIASYASVNVNVQPTLQSKTKTYTPTESLQSDTFTPGTGYDGLSQVKITVNAISSTYVGSGVPDNGSDEVTITGSQVTVASGYYEYSINKYVPYGHATTPSTTITANPAVAIDASGLITATTSASSVVTPTVSVGYLSVGGGNAGTISANGTGTLQLTTRAGATITPTTASQLAAASGVYTTGSVYVAPIPSAYVIPTGTSTINITANGTTTHDVSAFASAQVIANVPNSYSAADEGKVVSGATLVGQTSSTVTSNSTYDTTLINSLTVSVSGGGGGGDNKSVEAALIGHTISDTYENSVATVIGWYAFVSATALSHVNFPNVTTIMSSAFQGCTGLRTVSFPNATTIEGTAFASCTYLQSAVFPNVTAITASAFVGCQRMTYAEFPKLTGTNINIFSGCSSLASARFPMCQKFGSNTFNGCNSLATLIVGESAATSTTVSFYSSAFYRCYHLLSLYLLASFMYKLQNANVFTSTPISNYTTSTGGIHGSIFVKSSLYSSYISATNWTTYSARIVSLTDAQVANVIANGTHVI